MVKKSHVMDMQETEWNVLKVMAHLLSLFLLASPLKKTTKNNPDPFKTFPVPAVLVCDKYEQRLKKKKV